MKIETLIAIASFTLGIGSTLWAVVQWYSASQTKRYAAERDFGHLLRNYESIQQILNQQSEELEELRLLISDMSRVFSILLARGSDDTFSEILGKRK